MKTEDPHPEPSTFEEQSSLPQPSLLAEFWDFLIHNKKWWIAPILVVLFLVGLLVVLTASPIAPFIYPFF